jgi:hypothetical protein
VAAVSYLWWCGATLEQIVAGTNPPAGVVATVTAASAIIAAANSFTANQPVVFSGSFGTVTGLTAGTTYYVSATGLSSTQFEVSATPGGTVITPGGSASATPNVAALGAVELRVDQTSIVTDQANGTRPINHYEVLQAMRIIEQYMLRDPNVMGPQ